MKEIDKIEKSLAKIEQHLGALESQLADNSLYESERKSELEERLREQGRLKSEASELEESWLTLHDQLEELEISL
jgi:ATP-binding cassette subfamily F protein 3